MPDPKQFGQAIQTARRSQGLTQEQLGEQVRVSAQAVSKWENGESYPEVSLLPQICSALEISADALLGTTQNQGVDALIRGLRDRLGSLAPGERTRRLTAAIGHLLLHMADERVDEWAGEDFLAVGRGREAVLDAATLLTENGATLLAEAHNDAGRQATCDRLVEAGYLVLRRGRYEVTGPGLLVAGTILLLAEVPVVAGAVRRVRRVHTYES